MAIFNIRTKKERNSAYEQFKTVESLKEAILSVCDMKDEISMVEITKDGKLHFVFTIDDKTKVFLSVIAQLKEESTKEVETIPKTPKKARKTAMKKVQ